MKTQQISALLQVYRNILRAMQKIMASILRSIFRIFQADAFHQRIFFRMHFISFPKNEHWLLSRTSFEIFQNL